MINMQRWFRGADHLKLTASSLPPDGTSSSSLLWSMSTVHRGYHSVLGVSGITSSGYRATDDASNAEDVVPPPRMMSHSPVLTERCSGYS